MPIFHRKRQHSFHENLLDSLAGDDTEESLLL